VINSCSPPEDPLIQEKKNEFLNEILFQEPIHVECDESKVKLYTTQNARYYLHGGSIAIGKCSFKGFEFYECPFKTGFTEILHDKCLNYLLK